MRRVLKRTIVSIVVILGALWFLGPREPASLQINYGKISVPDDVDTYLSTVESRFDNIVPGTKKRVLWSSAPGEKTSVSIVYIHGFSASSEELQLE